MTSSHSFFFLLPQDGNAECMGRADDQVKIRGFRIELGEINATLSKHMSVKENVTVVREDSKKECSEKRGEECVREERKRRTEEREERRQKRGTERDTERDTEREKETMRGCFCV
jgi:acyl-coenzyme A synthetase/AMP-(fatty) acid ligase